MLHYVLKCFSCCCSRLYSTSDQLLVIFIALFQLLLGFSISAVTVHEALTVYSVSLYRLFQCFSVSAVAVFLCCCSVSAVAVFQPL